MTINYNNAEGLRLCWRMMYDVYGVMNECLTLRE